MESAFVAVLSACEHVRGEKTWPLALAFLQMAETQACAGGVSSTHGAPTRAEGGAESVLKTRAVWEKSGERTVTAGCDEMEFWVAV